MNRTTCGSQECDRNGYLSFRYGDKINVSFPGRIVQVAWSLTGLVLNGIAVGSIITSLYVNRLAKDPMIYDTKVIFLLFLHFLSSYFHVRRDLLASVPMSFCWLFNISTFFEATGWFLRCYHSRNISMEILRPRMLSSKNNKC